MSGHNINLTNEEIGSIIDCLIFLSCTDACYDSKDNDDERIAENMNRLNLAKRLKDETGQDCTNKVSVFEGYEFEDHKEAEFIKESFNIKITH